MSLPAECSVRSLAEAAHTWGTGSIEERWAMPGVAACSLQHGRAAADHRASVRYPQTPAFLLAFLPALK